MDDFEDFLRKLRENPATAWIADEIDETISQGVSMNVKDADKDSSFFELASTEELSTKEKNKRQNYETSRPYTEEEKIDLALKTIKVMYLDLPAIRYSALNNFREFCDEVKSISFSSDEKELVEQELVQDIKIELVADELAKYKTIHANFIKELDK